MEIISYGGGTQSTALILMALEGKYNLPRPDFAVYADVGGEPEFINQYVKYFTGYVKQKYDFDIYIVSKGNGLEKHLLEPMVVSKKNTALFYKNSVPPFHTLNDKNEKGMLMRQCTSDYKIKPIATFITKKIGRNVRYRLWIAISFDERSRMKISTIKKRSNFYPLVENFVNRADSIRYIKELGVNSPQRSSCVFCPFHSDKYWLWLKKHHLNEFKRAADFELKVKENMRENGYLKTEIFLHKTCKPLSDVNFDNQDQLSLFPELIDECDGYCGI